MQNKVRGLLLLALLAFSFSANADHHLMNIREVYTGSQGNPASQYVMLQMRFNFQDKLAGHRITAYNAAGTLVGTYTFAANVASGLNQRYVLIATTAAQTEFAVPADLIMTPVLSGAGGRVCFDNIDCVSWGSYSGSASSPSPTGTPFNVAGGISPGRAIRRDISGGSNPTQLDSTDDSNDSAADFDFAAAPMPTNNAAQAAPPAVGTGFNFGDFTDTSMLNSAGGAGATGGVLRLTPLINVDAPIVTSTWHKLYQPVAGGFETTFQFRITVFTGGSDGFVFVLGNESNTSVGAGGGFLGYTGVTNNLAVEFDTFGNSTEIGQADPCPDPCSGSPAQNHVSIHTRGTLANLASEAASIGVSAPLPYLDDGAVHTARIVYVPGSLQVYIDNMDVPVAQASVNLSSLLDLYNGAAFVGFTAATLYWGEEHDILNWQFGAATPDSTPNAFTFANVNGAPSAQLTSETRVVAGINTAVTVSLSAADASAKLLVNGVDVTAAPGTVKAGDTVALKLTTPATVGAGVSATLNVGAYTTTWTVTNADLSPTPFTFPNLVDAPSGSVQTSLTRTISGIDAAAPLSLFAADPSAKVLKNKVDVTMNPGAVVAGDKLTLRLTAPAIGGASASVGVTVGDYSTSWTVTAQVDTTPKSFTFPDLTTAVAGKTYKSASAKISQINAPAAVSLSSADPSAKLFKNGVDVTASPGTVNNGDALQLRIRAPASGNTASATLTVGTYSTSWNVSTP